VKQSIRDISSEELNQVEDLFKKNKNQLELYAELLLWWNKKINLVSRDVPRETVLVHIKHSLLISLSSGFIEANYIIDTGAGGGLPGIPLAICYPEKTFVINDIVSKKIFAVNDMVNKLGLSSKVSGLASDIKLVDIPVAAVIITKHAFKLDQLFKLTENRPWSSIVFLKGYIKSKDELAGLENLVDMDVLRLDSSFMPSFFEGKGLVEIKRKTNE